MEIPSAYIEKAVDQLASLPGIGRKTALRLVLSLISRPGEDLLAFGNAFISLQENLRFCAQCHNIAEAELCSICADPRRDQGLICVVENIRNVIAVENTMQFTGVYHVLGGIISPMNGISPSDLNMESLEDRIRRNQAREIVLALSATMEGDTTNFYIYRKLKDLQVFVSTIARGVAVGDELEYTDEVTLGRSILHRTPYENAFAR